MYLFVFIFFYRILDLLSHDAYMCSSCILVQGFTTCIYCGLLIFCGFGQLPTWWYFLIVVLRMSHCVRVWSFNKKSMCVSAGCVLQVWLRTNSFHSHWQCMRALTAVSSPTLGVLLIFSSCHCNECSLILFNSVYPVTSILPDVPLETPFFILQTHYSLLYMLAFSISSHEPVLSKPPSL